MKYSNTDSFYESSLKPLYEAAEILKLEPEIVEAIANPEHVLIVSMPVKMDDGKLKNFTGYRVRHNTARGPAKGGVRYHPSVCLEEVKALAFWMRLKR